MYGECWSDYNIVSGRTRIYGVGELFLRGLFFLLRGIVMLCVFPSGIVNRCPVGHLFLVTVSVPAHLCCAPMYGECWSDYNIVSGRTRIYGVGELFLRGLFFLLRGIVMLCVFPSGIVNRCPVGHLFLVTVSVPAHLCCAPMYGVTSKSVSCGHSGPDRS